MSALSLRLPNSIHAQVRALAEQEGISINQFIATALAEKLSALLTEEYLAARAARGSRRTFLSALDRVPAAAPEPADTPSRAATPKRRVSRRRRGSSKRR
ncbi:MAG TPA: toxin-antitoxin system HicB family antitoxin [Gemmatimonadales bacterium]|jgi:hypothetical protein|nr:toxin-antitoxin system HicB family antitoxin [Gemmatimonadales bacterium]